MVIDRFFEPSATLRLAFVATLVVASFVWLGLVAIPRLRGAITDRQLIALVHRDHPQEAALLSTALDVQERPSATNSQALTTATLASADAAANRLEGVRLVRPPAAMGSVGFAAVAIVAAVGFAMARPDMAVCFTRRVALSEEPWPRRVELVAEGFAWDATHGEWTRVAARGEPIDFTITAKVSGERLPPRTLWVRDPQRRRSTALTRVGPPTVGATTQQLYRRRIERLDEDRNLTIRGGDGRLSLRLIAADRPRLTELALTTTPPGYLDQPPAETSPATLAAIPEGGRLTLKSRSTKSLASVTATLRGANDALATTLPAALGQDGQSIVIQTPPLAEATVIAIAATDTDGLASEPFGLTIEVAKDQPPTVGLALDGVGRAVTRDAKLSVVLTPDDDHDVSHTELVLRHDDREVTIDLATPNNLPASVRGEADLLSMRLMPAAERLAVQPGDRVTVTARVSDRYDQAERVPTESRPIKIEIVTPAELLARIGDAQRELRQSLEGLLADVQRLEYELDLQQRRDTDGTSRELENWTAERLLDTRKASEGIAAAAERANGLRAQVVNNRLDQPALIDRLQRRVAEPLQRLVSEDLDAARSGLRDGDAPSIAAAQQSVRTAATVLEQVAGNLETQQTYNEVVALLRGLIREQRRVNQRTERQEGENVRSLFD